MKSNVLNRFFALALLVAGLAIFIPNQATAQVPPPDFIANILNSINNAKASAEATIQTGNSTKQLVKETVLDKLAIVAARIAAEKLTNATYQWVQGGFKGGEQLYVSSFKDFLAETGDAALRAGLNELTKNQISSVYNPAQNGEVSIGIITSPTWIQDYIKQRMGLKDDDALEKLVSSVGISEITNYCNGTGWDGGCINSTTLPIVGNCPANYTPNQCSMLGTEWKVNVALRNGTLVEFITTGWFGDESRSHPAGVSKVTTGVGIIPEGQSSDVRSYSDGQLNAFGTALTRSAVAAYQSTISGTIETTLKEELGPQWLNFANDITVGYNRFDPYAGWELLLAAGNNPVGTIYETANRIALSADKKLQAAVTEATAPGFLPDKTCKTEGAITFADGTEQTICKLYETNSPASLVGQNVGAAVTESFGLATDLNEWEQLGVQVLADATTAVVTGGLQAVAGEIRNKSTEVTAQIRQLGPISYLFGEATSELSLGDDQSWQLLSSRDIDFAELNERISLTAREARTAALMGEILLGLAGPTLVLDQECVFGPDFGWEQRLKSNFDEDITKLRTEVAKDEAAGKNSSDRDDARAQLLETLEEELESQIDWVKEAMPSNPFPFQQQFINLVETSIDDINEGKEFADLAAAKQAAATTLIQVRDTILSVPGAEVLLQTPPVWQENPEEVIDKVTGLGSIDESVTSDPDGGSFAITQEDILGQSNRDGTIAREGVPTITINRTNLTLPYQEEPYEFDVLIGVDARDTENDRLSLTFNTVKSAYDILVENQNNNILIERREEDGTYTQLTASTTISLNERVVIPEVLDNNGLVLTPETSKGIRYRVTYTVEDQEGNIGTARRFINVKTFDEYLQDLSDYNRNLSTFLQNIGSATRQERALLSQAVNLYLGVEKDLSSESSVRDTEGALEQARQKVVNMNSSLEICWLALYELDTLVPQEDFPRANNQPGNEGEVSPVDIFQGYGMSPSFLDEWADLQARIALKIPENGDSRIPYIKRSVPLSVSRSAAKSPLGDAVVGGIRDGADSVNDWVKENPWVRYLSPATILYSALTPDTPTGFESIVRYILKPDEAEVIVPDFQCSLDSELQNLITDVCTTTACVNDMYATYERYHCISQAINRPIDDEDNVQDRRNGRNDRIANAHNPGRLAIGLFEGVMDLPDHDLNDPGYQLQVDTCKNANQANGGNNKFKEVVLGSPINDCDFWYGTLIHRIPSIETSSPVRNGVAFGQASIHAFTKAWADNNYIWPATFNGWWETPQSNPRFWQSGVMHTVDVYGDHTKGVLYCRFNSVLFNPLWSFNTFKFGITDPDAWWTGRFDEATGQPITKSVGLRFWEDVQRCDDWTRSDLSTYTEFPNNEL